MTDRRPLESRQWIGLSYADALERPIIGMKRNAEAAKSLNEYQAAHLVSEPQNVPPRQALQEAYDSQETA